jgi:hypothetical protein
MWGEFRLALGEEERLDHLFGLGNYDAFVRELSKKCAYTVKKLLIFPSSAGMPLTKLSHGGNNFYMTSLFPPRESLVSDIPAGDGNFEKLFLWCM